MHDMQHAIHIDRSAAAEIGRACVSFNTRQLSRAITRIYDDALKHLNLRVTQFTILAAAIGANGEHSFTAMGQSLGMDRSTFSRNIQPLIKAGLLEISDEHEGRARSVIVTDAGHALFAKAQPVWSGVQDDLYERLGDETVNQLVSLSREAAEVLTH